VLSAPPPPRSSRRRASAHLRTIFLTRFEVPEAESQSATGPILRAPFAAADVVHEITQLMTPGTPAAHGSALR
jgi:hypothetical protein